MTVTAETSFVEYTGSTDPDTDGGTTEFPIPFKWLDDATIIVTLDGEVQEQGTDYTLEGEGEASGTVTMADPPADGAVLTIERVVSLTQTTPFTTYGPFSPSVHEQALDRLTMADQQLQRQIDDIDAEALDARLDEVEEESAASTAAVVTHETRLDALEPRVTAVEAQADATEADAAATQTQLDNLVLDVAEVQLVDGGVTTEKLANAAVTDVKLAPEAVSAVHLLDGAVETAKLGDLQVTTAKLAAGAVTQAKRAALTWAVSADINFNTTSDTYVAVTNASLSITTTGRPVIVCLVPTGDAEDAGKVGVTVASEENIGLTVGFTSDDGATFFAEFNPGGKAAFLQFVTGAFMAFWIPAAGTYTVKAYAKGFAASLTPTVSISGKLLAYEL